MTVDLADRLAAKLGYKVRLFETLPLPAGENRGLGPNVEYTVQALSPLETRVLAAIKAVFDEDELAHVGVFLDNCPLYPPALVAAGMDLLDQEDDVVVIGEAMPASCRGMSRNVERPLWVGIKRRHTRLLANLLAETPNGVAASLDTVAGSLVIPIGRQRRVCSFEDFSWLRHDIEREALLNRWFPRRTLEGLRRMNAGELIPEVD